MLFRFQWPVIQSFRSIIKTKKRRTMKTGKILLARPNSFIVKHMKRLIEESGNIPVPITKTTELEGVNESELNAIVISTSVSSVVEEGYFEVFQIVKEKFPHVPVFLASLTEVNSVKRAFSQNAKTKGLTLQSVNEADNSPSKESVVVIRKGDLIDQDLFQKTLNVMSKKVA